MTAQYDHVSMMIAERLAAIATERLANEARRARVAETRRLREMRPRVGGALAGAGSVITEGCAVDERCATARGPA